jgi:hypothetical protein
MRSWGVLLTADAATRGADSVAATGETGATLPIVLALLAAPFAFLAVAMIAIVIGFSFGRCDVRA